mgnify:FL=1
MAYFIFCITQLPLLLIKVTVVHVTLCVGSHIVGCHAVSKVPTPKRCVRPTKLPADEVRLQRPVTEAARRRIKRLAVLIIPARQIRPGSLGCHCLALTAYGAVPRFCAVTLCGRVIIVSIVTPYMTRCRNGFRVAAAAGTCERLHAFSGTRRSCCDGLAIAVHMHKLCAACSSCGTVTTYGADCRFGAV